MKKIEETILNNNFKLLNAYLIYFNSGTTKMLCIG